MGDLVNFPNFPNFADAALAPVDQVPYAERMEMKEGQNGALDALVTACEKCSLVVKTPAVLGTPYHNDELAAHAAYHARKEQA